MIELQEKVTILQKKNAENETNLNLLEESSKLELKKEKEHCKEMKEGKGCAERNLQQCEERMNEKLKENKAIFKIVDEQLMVLV